MGNHSLDLQSNSAFPKAVFTGQDIPFCLLLGAVAGLIGIVFNKGILSGTQLNKKIFGKNYGVRVAIAGFGCGLVIALLPESFRDFNGVRQLLLEGRKYPRAPVPCRHQRHAAAMMVVEDAPRG